MHFKEHQILFCRSEHPALHQMSAVCLTSLSSPPCRFYLASFGNSSLQKQTSSRRSFLDTLTYFIITSCVNQYLLTSNWKCLKPVILKVHIQPLIGSGHFYFPSAILSCYVKCFNLLHFSCLATVKSGEKLELSHSGLINLLRLLARTEARLAPGLGLPLCFHQIRPLSGRWWEMIFPFASCLPTERKMEGANAKLFTFCSHYKHGSSPVFQRGTLFFKGAIFFILSEVAKLFCHWRVFKKRGYMSIWHHEC